MELRSSNFKRADSPFPALIKKQPFPSCSSLLLVQASESCWWCNSGLLPGSMI
jgi:hypothetical protein